LKAWLSGEIVKMNGFIYKSSTTRYAALAFAGVLAGALSVAPVTSAAQQAVAVVVNGQTMSFDQPPIVQSGRVFVPLRSIFQQLGASVVYANGQINATGRGRTVSLTIGSTQATVSGQPMTLDVAPFVIGSRTLVPLRFVAQSLGANVNWNDSTSTVTIDSGNYRGTRVSQANPNVIAVAPPPLPDYQQPYAPAPNYIWTPGYWAWSGSGYYWVAGTWVQAPQTGLYWTPGYWSQNGSGYGWNAGYWAPQVGFYGGVNYGFGYFGDGYQGGRWGSNGFAYNTAYSNVNRTVITNTYINKTVINTTTINRVSYNGPNGIHAQPTAQQRAVATGKHVAMTSEQQRHQQTASQDRSMFESVNHGKPALPAVAKPVATARPETRPAPVAPVVRPTARPESKATPVPPVERATVRPETRPAPVAPVVRPTERPEPRETPVPPVERATARPDERPTARPQDRPTTAPQERATVKPEERATARPDEPGDRPDAKPSDKPTAPPPSS
jgi:Copper amine oxidase N-terminal domain/WXXGXW repeat (2 copies)